MGWTRRAWLSGIGCSLAASPLMTPVSFAALPGEARLVVVILRGGMDGLDVLRPVGDPMLKVLRPVLADGAGSRLTDTHVLHPALESLEPLWGDGQLGFAQAVSTPYRDRRSHFDGQDILEAGTAGDVPDPVRRDGWLNRWLQTRPDAHARTAFAIGREEMLLLRGNADHAAWAPDARLRMGGATQDLLLHVYRDDPLFHDAARVALELSAETEDKTEARAGEALFSFAAKQLRGDARIAALSLGGWDTHRDQPRHLSRALRRLSDGILRLRGDLGAAWDKTLLLAMTEFGRTAAENGSRGTDHGTGGTMILSGGALRGGTVWGDWPGLSEVALLDRRDVNPTGDVRRYAAWALRSLFGAEQAVLERMIFPGLEMAEDPRLLG
ncbi:MAG: DUF1501 domain-containing protein [Pseudomonadota bacterium]